MTKQQIQRIYGMDSILGILESGNKRDNLHLLVESITGKDSIKTLTDDEYKAVVHELAERIHIQNLGEPPAKIRRTARYEEQPGGMSEGQQRKVWHLMYELKKFDKKKSSKSLGERLCGIIKKEVGVDALPEKPLVWLTYQQGSKLIEAIKRYIRSAERKAMRGDGEYG